MQSSNYYQPNPQQYMMPPPIVDDSSIAGSGIGGGEEDDSDGSGMPDKRSGRRKIKIEYINDKSRRHITFSKRKAGIMKKAYELSTLTGTQVLLLVVSETGLVYTFTTPKLQPLVTKPEGKNLIQSCLNAPDPIDSSSNSGMDHHQHQQHQQQHQQQSNSRSIMSTNNNNAPTSPSTTNNKSYYQNLDSINNNYNNSSADGKVLYKMEDSMRKFGSNSNVDPSTTTNNPSLMLNNTTTSTSNSNSNNYSLPYVAYNNTANNNVNTATGASLYPYNLQDNNDRYWTGINQPMNNTTIKQQQRQDKR